MLRLLGQWIIHLIRLPQKQSFFLSCVIYLFSFKIIFTMLCSFIYIYIYTYIHRYIMSYSWHKWNRLFFHSKTWCIYQHTSLSKPSFYKQIAPITDLKWETLGENKHLNNLSLIINPVLHSSICQHIWKTQHWPQDWKRSILIPVLKKGSTKDCANHRTIALISHTSKVMLKFLHVRL